MKVAVVGAGVSGLVAAYTLAKAGARVVLYEKESYVGGHARTEHVDGVGLDLGFMVFNRVTYPNMVTLFEDLGVDMEESDMSFSVSLDGGRGCEWGSTGLAGLFAQKKNLFNPYFLQMIREILKFQHDVLEYLDRTQKKHECVDQCETLGDFLATHGYSDKFVSCYLVPVCASIWSCSSDQVLGFSALSILTFCKNHHLLQLFGRPQWQTVSGRSISYVLQMVAELERLGCEVKLSSEIVQVVDVSEGVQVTDIAGQHFVYDKCVIASHAPDALKLLGEAATHDERRVLGAFQYSYSDIYLHQDKGLMPRNTSAWSAWNFLGSEKGRVCLTYWLNLLQNLGDTGEPFLVTLNPTKTPDSIICKWWTGHPIPSPGAALAQREMTTIQGRRGIWFCGAYEGYGFHEDGLKSGMSVATSLLGRHFKALENFKQMTFSWSQSLARAAVSTFLQRFIVAGRIQLLETGGTILDFRGAKSLHEACKLRIHNPDFYWKLATRSDLGLAEAYMDGDFTCVKEDGLLNLMLILIENRDLMRGTLSNKQKRGWWTPVLLSASLGSAVSYLNHKLRKNSITNARQNISEHYDMSNEMFSLFMDETMTYSCAIFKDPDEPLKDAQMRKIHHLIAKARIKSSHKVLEIGFGWGSLAMEVVRLTGCSYTGISLSQEQLHLAEQRVKEAGLQDKITLLLCDYRTVQGKYDRIISCEMLEAVGPEYYEEFFRRCDNLLTKDGLMVVQVITVPEERYDELRRSSEFIKEYIFPGGSLPSLSALTQAMSKASSFSVEHLENIGTHYTTTLLHWRKNFQASRNDLVKLGFSDRFMRKWDYYFIYCAAGFKSCTLGNLQIVFSRPGNIQALGDPYFCLIH